MNTDVRTDWPIVPRAEFERMMATFDYRRDAWSNVIRYLERSSGREIGQEETLSDGSTQWRLHPGLREDYF